MAETGSARKLQGHDAIGVSVIIPVYRTPIALLRRCLDSLLGQSLRDIQIIAVDDASPDDCPAVLDEYAARDHRMTVVHRTSNGRAGLARNDGLAHAVGEYILFADSDDVATRDMCAKLLLLGRENEADIVASSWSTHDLSGRCIGRGCLPNRRYNLAVPHQQVQAARHVHYVLWNKLFRRQMISGLRFEAFPVNIGEDAVFNFACFSRSKVMVTTPYAGYRYTLNPNSACNRPSKGLPYLETSVAAHKQIVQLLTEGGAIQVVRRYGGMWAFGRFAAGCKWIADETDKETRSAMWNYWILNLQKNVLPCLRGRRVLEGLYRLLLATGNASLVYRSTNFLYRLASYSSGGALRDKIEARFFSRINGIVRPARKIKCPPLS
jgi:glycosyltransferase involved in cell wall biosynthesis